MSELEAQEENEDSLELVAMIVGCSGVRHPPGTWKREAASSGRRGKTQTQTRAAGTRRARRAQPSDAAPAGRPDTFLLIGAWVVTFLDQAPRQSDHGAAHWKAL